MQSAQPGLEATVRNGASLLGLQEPNRDNSFLLIVQLSRKIIGLQKILYSEYGTTCSILHSTTRVHSEEQT